MFHIMPSEYEQFVKATSPPTFEELQQRRELLQLQQKRAEWETLRRAKAALANRPRTPAPQPSDRAAAALKAAHADPQGYAAQHPGANGRLPVAITTDHRGALEHYYHHTSDPALMSALDAGWRDALRQAPAPAPRAAASSGLRRKVIERASLSRSTW